MAHTATSEAPRSYDEPAPTDDELDALFDRFERSMIPRAAAPAADHTPVQTTNGSGQLIDASDRFTAHGTSAQERDGSDAAEQRDPIRLRIVGGTALAGNGGPEDTTSDADSRVITPLGRVTPLLGKSGVDGQDLSTPIGIGLGRLDASDISMRVRRGGETRSYDHTQEHSDLIDEDTLPAWLRDGQNGTPAMNAEHLTRQEAATVAVGGEDEDTLVLKAITQGATAVVDDDGLKPLGQLTAADLFDPAQQLFAQRASEAPAVRPRNLNAEERARIIEGDQSSLLILIGQLENEWRRSSGMPTQDRMRGIRALARELTGLRNGEMTDILNSDQLENTRHDVAAMLHTGKGGERYAEADRTVQNKLGISLDELMALSIKVTQGHYAGGASVHDAIFGYLSWQGFRLPYQFGMTGRFAAMLSGFEEQPHRPTEQNELSIVGGFDLTQIRSDLGNQGRRAIAKAQELLVRAREQAGQLGQRFRRQQVADLSTRYTRARKTAKRDIFLL